MEEIQNCWVHTLNERLTLDHLQSVAWSLNKKAMPLSLLTHTWKGALLNEETLPENWLTKRDIEVLVGIEPVKRPLPDPTQLDEPLDDGDFG